MDRENNITERQGTPDILDAPKHQADTKGNHDSKATSWIVVLVTAIILFIILSSMMRLRGKTRAIRLVSQAPQSGTFDYANRTWAKINTGLLGLPQYDNV
jgi:hypothetical protein